MKASEPTPAFVDRKLEDDDDVRVVYQCKGWPLSVSLLCWLSMENRMLFSYITHLNKYLFSPHLSSSGTLLPVWSN